MKEKEVVTATVKAPALKLAGKKPVNDAISRLIGQFTPEGPEIQVGVGTETLTFHPMTDRKKIKEIRRRALNFAESGPLKVSQAHVVMPAEEAAALARIFDTDEETLIYSSILSELSIEPKLSPEDLLVLAKDGALAFEALKDGFNAAHLRVGSSNPVEAVNEAKND